MYAAFMKIRTQERTIYIYICKCKVSQLGTGYELKRPASTEALGYLPAPRD